MANARRRLSAIRPGAAPLLTLFVLLVAGAALFASPSGFWRIEVQDSAESSGLLVFRVTPEGGMPTEVEVAVSRGNGENRIARAIRSALREKLTEASYRIDVEHGEDVVIAARAGVPPFELELASSDVKGVEIELHLK